MADRPVGSCTTPDCQEHYSCRLRGKGLNVSPRLQTTRTQNWKPTPSVPPARNKEIIYSDRPGGAKMPVLKADGSVLRRKEFEEKRPKIESNIRRIRNSATGD